MDAGFRRHDNLGASVSQSSSLIYCAA
jgi:hypothetical protein